jgi:hypothetical protein
VCEEGLGCVVDTSCVRVCAPFQQLLHVLGVRLAPAGVAHMLRCAHDGVYQLQRSPVRDRRASWALHAHCAGQRPQPAASQPGEASQRPLFELCPEEKLLLGGCIARRRPTRRRYKARGERLKKRGLWHNCM